MLTCKQVCESASEAIEGNQALTHRLWLRLHLIICKHCRRYLLQMKIAIGTTARLPLPAPLTEAEIDLLVERLRQV